MSDQEIKITDRELRYIALFSTFTETDVVDCIETDDYLIFIVGKGQLTKAVGKGGVKTKSLSALFKKKVKVIEYSDDVKEFIANAMKPIRVEEITLTERPDGRLIAIARVPPEEKGKTIGKGGKNVETLRRIVRRHHKVESIIIQ